MWLLTQNKDCLVNLNTFNTVEVAGNAVIARVVGDDSAYVVIGRYFHDEECQWLVEDIAQFIKDSKALPFSDDDIVYFTK